MRLATKFLSNQLRVLNLLPLTLSASLLFACSGQERGLFGGITGQNHGNASRKASSNEVAKNAAINTLNAAVTRDQLVSAFERSKNIGASEFEDIKALPTGAYFDEIAQKLTNSESVEIMGREFVNFSDSLSKIQEGIEQLKAQYPTMETYLAANGVYSVNDLKIDSLESALDEALVTFNDINSLLETSTDYASSPENNTFFLQEQQNTSENHQGPEGVAPVPAPQEGGKDLAGCVAAIASIISGVGACIACPETGVACAGCVGGTVGGGAGAGKECRKKGH